MHSISEGASLEALPSAVLAGTVADELVIDERPTIRCSLIRRGRNPRLYFDPTAHAELVESVRIHGVIQPILVRPVGAGFEIIAGERRYRAAVEAHGDGYAMPVEIRVCSDAEVEVLANIENSQREDMSVMEEALSAARVLGSNKGDREAARIELSWSKPKLDSRLALMNCSPAVRTAMIERKILVGHAELFATLPKDKQDAILPAIIERQSTISEVKALIEQASCKLPSAIFDKTECGACPHNSSIQATFFAETISDGSCTNSSCFKGKTTAALEAIADGLKDEYPVIRIVRVGDNSTLTKLTAAGDGGVGEEQALECRACSDFGAAVSALPQAIGKVYKDQCFNVSCNSQKVAARIKAENAKEKTPAKATNGGSPDGASVKSGTPLAPPVTSVREGDRVKEFRVKLWRRAMKVEIAADPLKSQRYLLAICLRKHGGDIDGAQLEQALKRATGSTLKTDLGQAAKQVQELDEATFNSLHTLLAVSAIDRLDEAELRKLAKHHQLELSKHWKLDKEFLDLLTKSEIEVVAKAMKLDVAVGERFKKLMSDKKDHLIETLLKVDGFDYSANIPKVLRY
jgi:PRTRC genetic system ParB family protein